MQISDSDGFFAQPLAQPMAAQNDKMKMTFVILPSMSAEITKELFDHLVELAALELKSEEAEYIHQELNKQLKVIEELAAIPLDDSTPMASHGVAYIPDIRPPFRPDQITSSGISEEILQQTPETEAGYILVPEIPHETLE